MGVEGGGVAVGGTGGGVGEGILGKECLGWSGKVGEEYLRLDGEDEEVTRVGELGVQRVREERVPRSRFGVVIGVEMG